MTRCGCNGYGRYDPHAVYMSTSPYPSDGMVYEVEPIGEIWPDPEEASYARITRWCARSARVVAIHPSQETS